MVRVVCYLMGLLAALTFRPDEATADTLKLKITTYQARLRSQAPIPLELNLSWDGYQIIEGQLELSFHDREQQGSSTGQSGSIARYRSPELALSTGDRRFRIQLPPQRITHSMGLMGIQARFVLTGDVERSIDLGWHELAMPRTWQRRLRVAVVLPESQMAVAEDQLPFARALRIEQFRTQDAVDRDRRPAPLITQAVRVHARDVPRSPAELCVYDLIVLTRDGLAEVRPSSLDALTDWLRAGGSLLVDMGGVMETTQIEFLNELLTGNDDDLSVVGQLDGRAELRTPLGGTQVRQRFNAYGLGRCVICTESLETAFDFSGTEWRSLVAYLWKINQVQIQRVVRSPGHWLELPPQPDPRTYAPDSRAALQPAHFSGESQLTQLLLPDRVQSIPPWHVISLLAVFLLLIAPGDYAILGLLRRRTLTWILFPIVSLAVTVYTVRLAQNTVGSTDHSTSLTIVDFVDDTTIARTTRIEMLFTAAERNTVVDARDELFTPLVESNSEHDARQAGYRGESWRQNRPADSAAFQLGVKHEPPLYEGQLPRNYRVIRQMRKWTPQLCRRTWIGPPPDPVPEFDWSLIKLESLRDSESQRELANLLAEQVPSVIVTILSSDPQPDGEDPSAENARTQVTSQTATGNPSVSSLAAFVAEHSADWPLQGWSSVVTRMSPNGDAGLEDLRLKDWSNPNECLVIVTFREGDRCYALRRMYDVDPKAPKPDSQMKEND